MPQDKVNDDLYRRVEEHLQELIEPDLPEAKLSPAERLELLDQAQASEPCRELLESYEKTVSLLGALPDAPVPADFSRQVGERIDDSTPVIPFVKTVRFQRMAGAAAAVALMTFVVWRSVTPPAQEPFPELAINDPLGELAINEPPGELAQEIAADEPRIAPKARNIRLEKGPAPSAQKVGSRAEDKEVAAAAPAPGAADAVVPDDSRNATPGGVEAAVAAANKASREKPFNSIEVSRESIDGRLVAVRYEVAIPRSRLAELEAWQTRQGAARPAAKAEGASLGKSRARKASPPAARAKDKSAGLDAGQPTGEVVTLHIDTAMTLRVDVGKLEVLRSELASLQTARPALGGVAGRDQAVQAGSRGRAAKRYGKALKKADFAAAEADRSEEAKGAPVPEASSAPGAPESSRRLRRQAPGKEKKAASRESGAGRKENLRALPDPQQKLADSAPGVSGKAGSGKAGSGGKPKVRVDIRFRIVPD